MAKKNNSSNSKDNKSQKAYMIGNTHFDLPPVEQPKTDPGAIRNAGRMIDELLRDCGLGTYSNSGGGGYG